MKRQFKKALSIVVASSLALSMPVTTMADEAAAQTAVGGQSVETKETTKSEGIHATVGNTVTKNGDVVTKDTEGISADDNSKVTVNGNVTTSGSAFAIFNQNAEVKVTGNVTSDKDASYTRGGNTEIGGDVISKNGRGVVAEEGASTIVNGSVTANNTGVSISTYDDVDEKQDSSVRVDKGITVQGGRTPHGTNDGERTDLYINGAEIWKSNKDGKVDLQVNGDIHTTAKTDSEGTKIDRAHSAGISITNLSGEVSTKVNGGIKVDSFAGSKNFATGISISEDNYDPEDSVDKTQKTDVTVNGDITTKSDRFATGIDFFGLHGTTNVKVDGNISADANKSADGINLSSDDKDATANIIVNGDVTGSTYGTYFAGFDGTSNVVINGTLSGGESAVIITKETNTTEDEDGKEVTEKHGYNGNNNITVWKMTSDQDELVKVAEETRSDITGEVKSKQDAESADKVLKNINYIIRTDKVSNGTIHLSNTRLISGFDTARETEDITIKVEASDGYKVDSVKNGDAVLKKNADGTYTLTVPRGGGVQLSAVLSAIQKSQSSSSGSSGSSSSSHSSASSVNVQTTSSDSGATVATTVSDSNGTHNTNAVVKIANQQATVSTSEQTGNGNSIIIRNVSGDVAGATFAGVGTVSADGKSITTIDGQVFAVTYAPMLIIKMGDQSVGCFVDLTTGAPLATGKTEVYYQLAADGQMYAHWVNPMGFFYTGTVVLNGHTVTFNEQGVMIDVR